MKIIAGVITRILIAAPGTSHTVVAIQSALINNATATTIPIEANSNSESFKMRKLIPDLPCSSYSATNLEIANGIPAVDKANSKL